MSSQSEYGGWPTKRSAGFHRIDVLVNDVGRYWHTRHVSAD